MSEIPGSDKGCLVLFLLSVLSFFGLLAYFLIAERSEFNMQKEALLLCQDTCKESGVNTFTSDTCECK